MWNLSVTRSRYLTADAVMHNSQRPDGEDSNTEADADQVLYQPSQSVSQPASCDTVSMVPTKSVAA